MGASEIDLRTAEIHETRRTLDRHLRELEERLQPGRLMRPVVDRVRDTLGLSRESFLETVKREPVPLALTGLGLGWLLLRDLMGSRGRPVAGPEPEEPGGEAGGTVHRMKEGVARAAEQTKERVAHTAAAAREKVSQAAHGTVQQAKKAVDWVSQTFRDDPVLVGAAALATGLIAGVAIPASRSEEELAAPLADKAVQAAEQAVGSVLDTAKEKVEAAPSTPPAAPEEQKTGMGASAGEAETGEGD